MPEPATGVIDRDPVQQQVASARVPERVVRYVTSQRYGAQLIGPRGRCLYPPVRRGPRCPDEPVDLADVAELECTDESRVQLGVYRNDPGLAALALPHPDGGPIGVQRQVSGLGRQRLGDPEPGATLDQKQQPCPRVGAARISALTSCDSRYSASCSADFSWVSRRGLGCWPLGRR